VTWRVERPSKIFRSALRHARQAKGARDHALHTLSAAYAKSHGTVVVERLQTANMLRNRPLARRIADAGWSRMVDLFRYKLAFSGGRLVENPAAYSSQSRSARGAVDADSRHLEHFCCTHCGSTRTALMSRHCMLRFISLDRADAFVQSVRLGGRKGAHR
jgi:putative transposase